MSKSLVFFLAGAALLAVGMGAVWRENERPWQIWQTTYNAAAGVAPVHAEVQTLVPTRTGKPELCLTCHLGIEDISPSHPAEAMGCVVCHGGEPLALDADRAHANMRGGRNPSDLSVAAESCGTEDCHGGYDDPERNHVDRVLRSVQATYAGGIAAVRYTFGAQTTETAQLGVRAVADHGANVPEKAVPALAAFAPDASSRPVEVKLYADCLEGGCHLWSEAPVQPYYYRSTGCAACHYLYGDDGLYTGEDVTVDADEVGHGTSHKLTTAIPFSQCNHCHNRGNYSLKQMEFLSREDLPPVGAPLSVHMPPEGRRLVEYYQPIGSFSKCEVELNCVDCHTSGEVMGDGHIYGSKKDVQYVECRTCHGTTTAPPSVVMIEDPEDLALRQARLAGRADYLSVGDRLIETERGERLWSVKQTASGGFIQIDKVSGQVYNVPLVTGSKCTQDGEDQTSAYCHECHAVAR